MKQYYWVMVIAACCVVLTLYIAHGWIMAATGGGLWVLGWATHKHRTYVQTGISRVGVTLREKLVNWWRS